MLLVETKSVTFPPIKIILMVKNRRRKQETNSSTWGDKISYNRVGRGIFWDKVNLGASGSGKRPLVVQNGSVIEENEHANG